MESFQFLPEWGRKALKSSRTTTEACSSKSQQDGESDPSNITKSTTAAEEYTASMNYADLELKLHLDDDTETAQDLYNNQIHDQERIEAYANIDIAMLFNEEDLELDEQIDKEEEIRSKTKPVEFTPKSVDLLPSEESPEVSSSTTNGKLLPFHDMYYKNVKFLKDRDVQTRYASDSLFQSTETAASVTYNDTISLKQESYDEPVVAIQIRHKPPYFYEWSWSNAERWTADMWHEFAEHPFEDLNFDEKGFTIFHGAKIHRNTHPKIFAENHKRKRRFMRKNYGGPFGCGFTSPSDSDPDESDIALYFRVTDRMDRIMGLPEKEYRAHVNRRRTKTKTRKDVSRIYDHILITINDNKENVDRPKENRPRERFDADEKPEHARYMDEVEDETEYRKQMRERARKKRQVKLERDRAEARKKKEKEIADLTSSVASLEVSGAVEVESDNFSVSDPFESVSPVEEVLQDELPSEYAVPLESPGAEKHVSVHDETEEPAQKKARLDESDMPKPNIPVPSFEQPSVADVIPAKPIGLVVDVISSNTDVSTVEPTRAQPIVADRAEREGSANSWAEILLESRRTDSPRPSAPHSFVSSASFDNDAQSRCPSRDVEPMPSSSRRSVRSKKLPPVRAAPSPCPSDKTTPLHIDTSAKLLRRCSSVKSDDLHSLGGPKSAVSVVLEESETVKAAELLVMLSARSSKDVERKAPEESDKNKTEKTRGRKSRKEAGKEAEETPGITSPTGNETGKSNVLSPGEERTVSGSASNEKSNEPVKRPRGRPRRVPIENSADKSNSAEQPAKSDEAKSRRRYTKKTSQVEGTERVAKAAPDISRDDDISATNDSTSESAHLAESSKQRRRPTTIRPDSSLELPPTRTQTPLSIASDDASVASSTVNSTRRKRKYLSRFNPENRKTILPETNPSISVPPRASSPALSVTSIPRTRSPSLLGDLDEVRSTTSSIPVRRRAPESKKTKKKITVIDLTLEDIKQELEDTSESPAVVIIETDVPKQEPQDDIVFVEPVIVLPTAVAEKDVPYPVPTKPMEISQQHEYFLKKFFYESLSELFSSDPDAFSRMIIVLAKDEEREGNVYLESVELKSRTCAYSKEFIQLVVDSDDEQTYAGPQWRNYATYTGEFRQRCPLSDVLRGGLTPKNFFAVVELAMDAKKRLTDAVPSKMVNKAESEFMKRAETALIARVVASTMQMASVSDVQWASSDHIRRRFDMLVNGWKEFIHKGGFLRILVASLTPFRSQFLSKEFISTIKHWNEQCEGMISQAIILLETSPEDLTKQILEEADVEEEQFIACNEAFSNEPDDAHQVRCMRCQNTHFANKSALATHDMLFHQYDCEHCYEDLPNKKAQLLHNLVAHHGIIS